MLALWLWQSPAWTQPQSALSQLWLGAQAAAIVMPVALVLLYRKR
jgi:hypothetical protein